MRRGRRALGGFLGNVIMSIMSYEGKCGLPALACSCRGNSVSLKGGPRAPEKPLGNTMMRPMIGRYKGFRRAGMAAGVKGCGCRLQWRW